MPKENVTKLLDSLRKTTCIGIDIRCLSEPRTGVGTYVHDLLRALFTLDQTREYVLISTGRRVVSLPLLEDFPNVRRVHISIPNKILHMSMRLFRWPRLDRLAARSIGITSFDLYISGNIHIMSITPGLVHLAMIHDLSFFHIPDTFSLKRRLWHWIVKPFEQIERADHIIVNSTYTKDDIMRTVGIREDRLTVISPGSSITEQSDEASVRERYELPERFVCCLATIEPRKNIAALIQAFTTSKLPGWGYDLVLLGGVGWSSRGMNTLIAQTPGVRHLGFVKEEDKYAILQSAKLFVYPSLFEGFGMPVLEAMTAGVPVIAGANTSLFELTDGAAWLVGSLSISDIREVLEEMVSDETRRIQYARLGSLRASRYFWEQAALSIHTLLKRYEG